MSTINSKTARELLEAYHAVYQTEETITEEQLWEEVENWVNSLIEEGYDLSEYTWEDMYVAYIEEQRPSGSERREQQAQIRATRPQPGNVKADSKGNIFQRAEAERIKGANKLTQDARAIFGMDKNKPSASKTAPPSKFRDLGRKVQQNAPKNEPMVLRGVDGKPLGKPPSSSTGNGAGLRGGITPAPLPRRSGSGGGGSTPPTPAPSRTPAPTAAAKTAPRPSAPAPAKQTGDKAKDMATWAKANPTLAAKNKTPNPLMQKTFGYQTGQQPTKPSGNIKPNVTGMKSGRLATAISGPNKKIGEGYDAYDIVLNYIAENGHAESLDEAHYIMMEMSPEMIQDIVTECEVINFLCVEGYVDTLEEAEWMMANLIDEEAVDIILGEEQLDEISQKTATRAYAASRTGEFEGADSDRDLKRSDNLEKHIKRKFGDKAVKHAERAAEVQTFGRKDASGRSKQSPKPRIEKSDYRTTQDGKMHKQDQKELKTNLRIKRDRRLRANRQEEFEAWLDEADSLAAMQARREKRLKAQRKREGTTAAGNDFGHDYSLTPAQQKARRDSEFKAGIGTKKEEFDAWLDEAMSNYEKNRKRAAQRAAARNAARDAGKTGVVPGVGYVSPRRERETWTDESGQERHTSGARMPKKK